MYYFFMGMLQLPVPPDKMSLSIKGKNKTINLINEGECNLIKTPGLSEISFDVRLPNQDYPWAAYDNSLAMAAKNEIGKRLLGSLTGGSRLFGFTKADFYLKALEQYKVTRTPFRFIVTRMGSGFNLLFSTNMLVTLESYTIEEDAENDGMDVTVPVRLKQYRPFGTKTATLQTDENGNQKLMVNSPRETEDMAFPHAIEVTKGMTVWEAVKGATNGSLDWRQVAINNGIYNPVEELRKQVIKF